MSASNRDISVLQHIADYCDQIDMTIETFGDDFEIFDKNQIYRNAASLCILQIGELVGVLTDEFKGSHEQVPWMQIKKMRNIVAHRYGTVDNTIVWDVMKDDIPSLKQYCESILADEAAVEAEEQTKPAEENK